ncbi:hypothetical protein ACFLZ2_04180 [Candidatus Margulisiibacteriota bacterium]
MKKLIVLAVSLILVFACGFAGPAPEKSSNTGADSGMYMIDDFEDGNYTSNPEWWKFDNVNPNVVSNDDYQKGDPISLEQIKKYSLNITGNASDWFAGGMGTYIARRGIDLSKYNTFMMDVYGNGAGSGTLKIEINDDDNGNWQIEQDPNANFANIYDDKFSYSLIIDWSGWKRVKIPVSDFIDENPGVGDDIWDPEQIGGSGGMVQLQLVCIGSKKIGVLKFNVDNISLTVEK